MGKFFVLKTVFFSIFSLNLTWTDLKHFLFPFRFTVNTCPRFTGTTCSRFTPATSATTSSSSLAKVRCIINHDLYIGNHVTTRTRFSYQMLFICKGSRKKASSLMAVGMLVKKGYKKTFFSLIARPYTPKRRTFFCGFPKPV